MTNQHGDFLWYELLTTDPDAASRFYGGVLGWRSRPAGGTVPDYHVFGRAGTDVGGFMRIPDADKDTGMRPGWLGYVAVNDVDAAARDIVADGGRQYVPPTDIPGIGRFALLSDPQGAPIYVMRGASDETSSSFDGTRPGHCHWNELATTDQAGALSFYGRHFGWAKGDGLDMGAMGTYQFLTRDGQTFGALMTAQPGQRPAWTFYFGVEDIDAAATAVAEGGGTVMHGPAEVPGGSLIVVAADPQGAVFGLVGPRRP